MLEGGYNESLDWSSGDSPVCDSSKEKGLAAAFLTFSFVSMFAIGCWPEARDARPDILLISIDTLRADPVVCRKSAETNHSQLRVLRALGDDQHRPNIARLSS